MVNLNSDVSAKTRLEVKNSISRNVCKYVSKNKDESTKMMYFGLNCRIRDTFILEAFDAENWLTSFYKFNNKEDEKLYYDLVSDLADFYRAVADYYTYQSAAQSTGEDSYMNPERIRLRDKSKKNAKNLYESIKDNWDESIIMPVFLPWIIM